MSEYPAELIATVRIETVFVILAKQVKETVHILFVYERIIIFGTEELTEVKSLLIFHILTHQIA